MYLYHVSIFPMVPYASYHFVWYSKTVVLYNLKYHIDVMILKVVEN